MRNRVQIAATGCLVLVGLALGGLPAAAQTTGCRGVGGLNDVFDTGSGLDAYRAGGQVGASTGLLPQPAGEWTHSQRSGPSGSFTFHAGTASAPSGTGIVEIRCSDPGWCRQAAPAPDKQLDFDGIGTFKNIGRTSGGGPSALPAGANAIAEGVANQAFDGTFHWFEVNIDDLGEPGKSDASASCPANGFGEKGQVEIADCSCPDFYGITIYNGVAAADVTRLPSGRIDPASLDRTNVIYEVWGYIDGGNLQILPPAGSGN